jgi:biotin synthase
MIRPKLLQILRSGEQGEELSAKDLAFLLTVEEEEEMEALFQAADRVRRRFVGEEIHLRGIVEFSNVCIQNCLYCGLRRDNQSLLRYRMTPGEVQESAKEVQARGIRTLVLQSGEDPWYTRDRLSELIRRIKKETGLTLTLSVGERPREDYWAWKEVGADRYLLKQETSAEQLFAHLRPGRTLTERLESLRFLRELGYEVGSGNMVGLPGQGDEDLVRDIQLFREFDFDMIGIGPFIPHPQTPLGNSAPADLNLTLKVLALTRITTRNTHLPATTASAVLSPEGRKRALMAGANVIMPNLTPRRYREYYQVYPGKGKPDGGLDSTLETISSLGRTLSQGSGYRRSLRSEGCR